MKRWLLIVLAAGGLLTLAGCATPVVRSSVTAFHEWTPALASEPYVFERSVTQDADLEYRTYENLVRSELQKLGLKEAEAMQKPKLTIKLNYAVKARDVRILQPVMLDPYSYRAPVYSLGWRRHYNGPIYDPFWFSRPMVRIEEQHQVVYRRQLNVMLTNTGNARKVYDVTVNSEGRNGELAAVMPYMVSSAFAGFPGDSGVPRRIDLPLKQ